MDDSSDCVISCYMLQSSSSIDFHSQLVGTTCAISDNIHFWSSRSPVSHSSMNPSFSQQTIRRQLPISLPPAFKNTKEKLGNSDFNFSPIDENCSTEEVDHLKFIVLLHFLVHRSRN